jgi:phosphatidylglycerophosphate synthase
VNRDLRRSAVTSQLAGLIAVAVLASVARAVLPLGPRYVPTATALFAVTAAVTAGFVQRHHPFARFGAANQVTTVRAIFVVLVVALAGEPRVPAVADGAVVLAAAATLLDGVDGWLARRDRIASAFGARFDMEVDAFLILALSVLVWRFGKAGGWVVASGLLRYVFVAAGRIAPWLRAPLPPDTRRQAICVIQIAALTLAMIPAIEPPVSTTLAAAALAALGYSFLVDTVWLWRRSA